MMKTIMNTETNETDKEREQRRGRKQRLTTANNQSLLTQLHVMVAEKYLQNRMQMLCIRYGKMQRNFSRVYSSLKIHISMR